jgi:hypothetical protein
VYFNSYHYVGAKVLRNNPVALVLCLLVVSWCRVGGGGDDCEGKGKKHGEESRAFIYCLYV